MVKAPNNPVIKKARHINKKPCRDKNKLLKNPIKKQPIILTSQVPHGKLLVKKCVEIKISQYRSKAPNAPPIAIAAYIFIHAPADLDFLNNLVFL